MSPLRSVVTATLFRQSSGIHVTRQLFWSAGFASAARPTRSVVRVDAPTPPPSTNQTNQSRRRFRRKNRSSSINEHVAKGNRKNEEAHTSTTSRAFQKMNDRRAYNRNHEPVRLSKRMSKLDLCSRREADRLIAAGRVLIGGRPVEPELGQKVDPNETDIAISFGDWTDHKDKDTIIIRPSEFDWDRMRGETVVLHKPAGYVSGQPEESVMKGSPKGFRHEPAVRLLTKKNLYIRPGAPEDEELQETSNGNHLHFARKKNDDSWWDDNKGSSPARYRDATLVNYVPSGRLDLESTGLLIFTKNGVMAKKLISPKGLVEKEYILEVSPVQSLTRIEQEMGMTWLPEPTKDLRPLLRGGLKLFGEHRFLRPVVEAEWISDSEEGERKKGGSKNSNNKGGGTLRVVLREGMKRHLRRACRELLGLHVDSLVRTKIGDVTLDIPEGKWRPLREHEARSIFFAGRIEELAS